MKIAIIGAGIGGMAAAYDLRKAGHEVTIFEGASHAGGLASGFKEPGWDWSVEKFYHHWFESDKAIFGLMDELGLREKVIFQRPVTVMFHEGKFYPFDSIVTALLFPGLGWGINKIRFGLVGLYLKLTNNWKGLEQTTVERWMRKWAGDRVYELMWEPLMAGKFGPYQKVVNMAWMWARLKSRTTRLGTYQGGFQAFCDDFAERLLGMGVEIYLNAPISRIERQEGRGVELTLHEGLLCFDQCLVTTSPGLLAKLAPDLSGEYLKGLLSLKNMGAVVMVLSVTEKLSREGYYWYNIPKKAGFPFLALVEHTNFVPAKNFGGEHILYCGDYLEEGHEYFSLSDEALLERFLPALQRINTGFGREKVRKLWVFKTNYAQPIPEVNHSRNIPDIRTPVAGLYFASMSQVYPWDRGTNFAVEIGRRAARSMLAQAGEVVVSTAND